MVGSQTTTSASEKGRTRTTNSCCSVDTLCVAKRLLSHTRGKTASAKCARCGVEALKQQVRAGHKIPWVLAPVCSL